MKKERVVVLCLCIILSGSIHTQWIAWACRHALPSQAGIISSIWTGTHFGVVRDRQHPSGPSSLATTLACAAWPPLGILYDEAILVGKWLKATPEDRAVSEPNPAAPQDCTGIQR
jgi:hypothetical protein